LQDRWKCTFIGKGNKEAEQELYAPAVQAAKTYFKKHFRRDPGPKDYLFHTIPVFADDEIKPMPYHVLWYRIHEIGEKARKREIIKRDEALRPRRRPSFPISNKNHWASSLVCLYADTAMIIPHSSA